MNSQMILPRVISDETTFAVVEFRGVERLDLKQAVQRDVTAWVKHSEPGRQAFDNASEDLNVGDLANELGDPTLLAELNKQGVTHLAIDIYCDDLPTEWEFDVGLCSMTSPAPRRNRQFHCSEVEITAGWKLNSKQHKPKRGFRCP